MSPATCLRASVVVRRSAYGEDVAAAGEIAEPASSRRGFVLAFLANIALAVCSLGIAGHWNGRGGEEWSVGLVIGAAVLTAVLGTGALLDRRKRAWGLGLLVAAVLAPFTVGAAFIWYFAILNGS